MEIIKSNPSCTLKEMQESLNAGHNTVERNLKKLHSYGYVDRVGARKTGKWIILK